MVRRVIAALCAALLLLADIAQASASVATTGGGGSYNVNNRIVFYSDNAIPIGQALIFTNATDVENLFGAASSEYANASQFYSGSAPSGALFGVGRLAVGRARVFGANIKGALTSIQSQCGNPTPCNLSLTYRGYTTTVSALDLYQGGAVTSIGSGSCGSATTTVCGVLTT
jgi:hypothetical protein